MFLHYEKLILLNACNSIIDNLVAQGQVSKTEEGTYKPTTQ